MAEDLFNMLQLNYSRYFRYLCRMKGLIFGTRWRLTGYEALMLKGANENTTETLNHLARTY